MHDFIKLHYCSEGRWRYILYPWDMGDKLKLNESRKEKEMAKRKVESKEGLGMILLYCFIAVMTGVGMISCANWSVDKVLDHSRKRTEIVKQKKRDIEGLFHDVSDIRYTLNHYLRKISLDHQGKVEAENVLKYEDGTDEVVWGDWTIAYSDNEILRHDDITLQGRYKCKYNKDENETKCLIKE